MKKIILPKSKNKIGYTNKEIRDIIRRNKVSFREFWKKLGVNTVGIDKKTGEHLVYGCDVELAIKCCLQGREKYLHEWD